MDPDTTKVLDSIRQMLAESGNKKAKSTQSSPYARVDKELQELEGKHALTKKKKTKTKNLPSISKSAGSLEEVAVRTIRFPYVDSVLLVDESLEVAHTWSLINAKSHSKQIVDGSNSEINALLNRFPRFTEGLDITSFETADYKMRGDIWLIRIIEESYDAALAELIKPVSKKRSRRRYDLDLGALDSFPYSVKRYIAQKYSAIDILPQICVELLLCLNRVNDTMDQVLVHRHIDGKSLSHGGRAFLFASFLSEEFDVDRLATYLHTRDVVQDIAGVKFKDIAVHLVYPNPKEIGNEANRKKKEGIALLAGHPFLSSATEASTLLSPTTSTLDTNRPSSSAQHGSRHLPSGEDLVDAVDAAKVCPVKLPYSMRVVHDCTMPETPLLAVDVRSLRIICQKLTPRRGSDIRWYLYQKVMMWTDALINMQTSMFKILLHLQDPALFDACKFTGIAIDGVMVVPAHVIVWMVCTEISYCTPAVKTARGNPDEPEKSKDGGVSSLQSTEEGIYMLNNLYDNNREKVRQADAAVAAVELEMSHASAKVLNLEKRKKRIERKWREYVPDHSLSGLLAAKAEENKGYDLNELAAVRASVAEAQEEKFGIEAKLRRVKKKRTQLLASIESTWESTIAGKAIPSHVSSAAKSNKEVSMTDSNSRWRDVVLSKIAEAIIFNSTAFETTRESRNDFDRVLGGVRTGDAEVDKAYMYPPEELMSGDRGEDLYSATVSLASRDVVGDGCEEGSLYALSPDGSKHEDEQGSSADVMIDIATQIAALEGEARKLAAVGRIDDVNNMTPSDILCSPLRLPRVRPDRDEAVDDLDEIRVQLASREAECFVDSVLKKHGLDDENYMKHMESGLSETHTHLASSDPEDNAPRSSSAISQTDAVVAVEMLADKVSQDEDISIAIKQMSMDSIDNCFSISADADEDEDSVRESNPLRIDAEDAIDGLIPDAVAEAKDIPDFELYEFVSSDVQNIVEEKHTLIQNTQILRAMGSWTHFVNEEKILKTHLKAQGSKRCGLALLIWKQQAIEIKVTKAKNVILIQCLVRRFISRRKMQRVRRAEEARAATLTAGLKYIQKIHMRRAIRALGIFKERRKMLRRKSELVRMKPFFKNWCVIQRQVRLVHFMRAFLARRRVYRQRMRRTRLDELNMGFPVIHNLNQQRKIFRHWRVFRSCSVIFNRLYKSTYKTKMLRRWSHWKNMTIEYITFRTMMATRIAATVRMHLSKRKNVNFYAVRRGMVTLQCVVRGRIAQTVVAEVRRRFAAAIAIQHVVRGYLCRVNMRANRIKDIHNAASSDNYDRLLYYLERYYNLTFQLDDLGNSALHNASQNASKRCVKLLLRYHHDPTLVNPNGYSPIHLLIMSATPYRDSMFEYMLSVGFDEFQRTADEKTALILAAENGRVRIVSTLLERDHNPNDIDSYGATALQYACIYGYEPIVRNLLEYSADCNIPGYQGMLPLHDVTTSGSVPITNLLLESGAIVDVQEPSYGYTPLMMACKNGLEEIVDLMLLQAPNVNIRDFAQCTVAHHCVHSDSLHIANALREADVDFTVVDFEGNSPLHYAAQYGAVNCMAEFLYSLAPASLQNIHGNQPSHIAAQYNQVGCLKALLLYDEHIGRMNFKHMTPLGMAKFHMAKEAQLFLEDHFRKIDGPGVRNAVGDVWWDKELDKHISDWRVVVDESNHRHYINDKTGEITLDAPKIKLRKVEKVAQFAQVPMAMRVRIQEHESTLNHHDYDDTYHQNERDVAEAKRLDAAATMITKTARRKLVYKRVIRLQEAKKKMDVLARFIKRALDTVIRWKLLIRSRKVTRVQALFRGYSMRCHFYYWDGTYQDLWYELAKRRLARNIWTMWKNYKTRQMQMTFHVAANAPRLITDWEPILDQVGYPIRTVGIIEEYLYPQTNNIYFYRNFETGAVSFDKPKALIIKDRKDFLARTMRRERGYTPAELWLALKLQALWRGYKVRMMYVFIVRATAICIKAESTYLESPDSDRNLFNYTLYCHVVMNDYNRARPLYLENMRRMAFKGPDVPQILYAYAIFAFVTHDLDVEECYHLIERARVAEQAQYNYLRKQKHRAKILEQGGNGDEPYEDIPVSKGKSFELAHVGFFRYMCNLKNNSDGFHNYAAVRFLIYDDFASSFDAFMGAFKSDPMNDRLRANYEVMLQHFFGDNLAAKETIVNKRMQFLAAKDNDEKTARRERIQLGILKFQSAKRIQKWYRHHRGLRDFYSFVARLRRKRQKMQSDAAKAKAGKSGPSPI